MPASNTERFSSDSDILCCGEGLVLLKEAEPQEIRERLDQVPLTDPGLEEVWLKELLVELSSLEVRARPV